MHDLVLIIISKLNYWIYIALMMIGLYAMITKKQSGEKGYRNEHLANSYHPVFHFRRCQE